MRTCHCGREVPVFWNGRAAGSGHKKAPARFGSGRGSLGLEKVPARFGTVEFDSVAKMPGRVTKFGLPHQYRVRDAQLAFPSLERHNPKRTCLLDYGPCLPACGIPMLAFYIRLRRAYDDLRAHPHR